MGDNADWKLRNAHIWSARELNVVYGNVKQFFKHTIETLEKNTINYGDAIGRVNLAVL
jgi:hypothetical protein